MATRYFTLQILAPSHVLLVCDDPDDSRVLSQTITASAGLVDESETEFLVERIEFADLSVVRLSEFDAVILLDPPPGALGDGALSEFAKAGGGVLTCLGPSAGDERIESSLTPTLVRRWRVPDPGTFFQVIAPSHPVAQSLSSDTPWSDFRVHQYWQLAPEGDDAVLIGYAGTSHAAMIQLNLQGDAGDQPGRVLVLSTPIPALSASTRSWNDLFGTNPWPAWLLTRQCIEYLTRRGDAELMSLVGRPQRIALAGDTTEPTSRPERLQLFPPGDTAPVPIRIPQDANQVTISDVSQSGTYWIRGGVPGQGFSANLPADAIELARIDSDHLDEVFSPGQYTLATDRDGIEFAEHQSSRRVSLHSPAILLALMVFLLEQVLSNRFYRARAAAA